ncbi:hypothetical protein G9P44_004015 [Scheffersomyces stipitis]|nr:hypothetical protein G9P44_004015 [Scheffersomyces stipitis]
MSWLHVWKPILVNRSNRPILQDGEDFLCTKDYVGLYQGKSKILARQKGIVYLTNKRIIYFDSNVTSNSVAIELAYISHCEVIEKFFRSSPKIKAYLKTSGKGKETESSLEEQPKEPKQITWICKICSYSNTISSDFDLDNELPKCVSCGIRPNRVYITKIIEEGTLDSAIGSEGTLDSINSSELSQAADASAERTDSLASQSNRRDDQCPQCTFINHPSMKYCELCGTELKSVVPKGLQLKISESLSNLSQGETNSENPLGLKLDTPETYTDSRPYIKISFRNGGESEFGSRLTSALENLKWEALKNRGAINQNATKLQQPKLPPPAIRKAAGIHGLVQLGEQQRKQNEIILSTSLVDLENLMFKSQDLIKLSNSFTKFIIDKKHPRFSLPASTKLVPPLDIKKASSLYHNELSRHISEYSVNYELTRAASMITSQELFANYNRYLVLTQGFGADLVTPQDFNKAIEKFEDLKLPIRMKHYEKSGLVVLAPRSKTGTYEENILACLRENENNFKYNKLRNQNLGLMDEFLNDEYRYFQGNNISEISDKFGWSYNITIEEIEKCIENGTVVIDQSVSGTFYFINKFASGMDEEDESVEVDKKGNHLGVESDHKDLKIQNGT